MINQSELVFSNMGELTCKERELLDTEIDCFIELHQMIIKDINKLIFDSINMILAKDNEKEWPGVWRQFINGIMIANEELGKKLIMRQTVRRYVSEQVLRKLAKQHLIAFEVSAAANNKLYISRESISGELNNIFKKLKMFFRTVQRCIVQLEIQSANIKCNNDLLIWRSAIEYLEFEGAEYRNMDDTRKIVCLARNFYDITGGNYSISDLLFLKVVMAQIDMDPQKKLITNKLLVKLQRIM